MNFPTRLTEVAALLAKQFAAGRITTSQLREHMRRAITEAYTIAVMAATENQHNAAIDTLLRNSIQQQWTNLDHLIMMLQSIEMSEAELNNRLRATGNNLEDVFEAAKDLADKPVDLLTPILLGASLLAFVARARRHMAQRRQTLQQRTAPRRVFQSGQWEQLPPTQAPRLLHSESPNVQPVRTALMRRMDALTARYVNGEITATQWHRLMREEVRRAHEAFAALGGGTLDDARLHALYEKQLPFIDQFARDIESLSPSQIANRARMYIDTAQPQMQEAAFVRLNMEPLPAYPRDGTTQCLSNCQCRWHIDYLGGRDLDAQWQLGVADHCNTCIQRERLWTQIRIRNGQLQPYPTAGVFA